MISLIDAPYDFLIFPIENNPQANLPVQGER